MHNLTFIVALRTLNYHVIIISYAEFLIKNTTPVRLLLTSILLVGFVMRRELSGQLSSLFIQKHESYIDTFAELAANIDTIEPLIQSKSLEERMLASSDQADFRRIYAKARFVDEFALNEHMLDRMLAGELVIITDDRELKKMNKLYRSDKLRIAEDMQGFFMSVRFPISNRSKRRDNLYQM